MHSAMGRRNVAEAVCPNCGYTKAVSGWVWTRQECPKCKQEMMPKKEGERALAARTERSERIAKMREKGIEPIEYKVVGLTRISGAADETDIQKMLDKMAMEGWEFAFFCDGPHLVAGAPALVFKRKPGVP